MPDIDSILEQKNYARLFFDDVPDEYLSDEQYYIDLFDLDSVKLPPTIKERYNNIPVCCILTRIIIRLFATRSSPNYPLALYMREKKAGRRGEKKKNWEEVIGL